MKRVRASVSPSIAPSSTRSAASTTCSSPSTASAATAGTTGRLAAAAVAASAAAAAPSARAGPSMALTGSGSGLGRLAFCPRLVDRTQWHPAAGRLPSSDDPANGGAAARGILKRGHTRGASQVIYESQTRGRRVGSYRAGAVLERRGGELRYE